jgi:hypothetical protein
MTDGSRVVAYLDVIVCHCILDVVFGEMVVYGLFFWSERVEHGGLFHVEYVFNGGASDTVQYIYVSFVGR